MAGYKKSGATAYYARRFVNASFNLIGSILFIFKKNPGKIGQSKIRKILIVRLDRIGDLVLTTPAIRALRKTFLTAEIHLMVKPYTKDIVVNNPNVNRILLDGVDRPDNDYDLAFALQPSFRANYLTFTSGSGWRFGYGGAAGSFFLTGTCKDDRFTRVRHEVDTALEITSLAGCETGDTALEVSVTDQGRAFADDFFKHHSISDKDLIVAIHPGSRQSYIRWNPEGYAAVADEIVRACGAKIVLVAGRNEEVLAEGVRSRMKENVITAGNMALTELISLLQRCSLFIGNSTGPMHIASGLGVPVVAIFGPVNPLDSWQEWGPRGGKSIVISKNMDCSHCHPTDCNTFECLNSITPQEVISAARQIIEGGN